MLKKQLYFLLISILTFAACKEMESTIEIEFEDAENELVVECYLEIGQPLQLLLTETKDYFEPSNICPFVRHALVVITHNGVRDTLTEASYSGSGCSSIQPFYNADSTRFFNYGCPKLCPADYNHPFLLEVWDTLNDRYVSAFTQILPPVEIDIFNAKFNEDTIAAMELGCPDDLNTQNYYRMTLHKWSTCRLDNGNIFKYVANNPYFDELMYDQAIYSDGRVIFNGGYDFYRNDTAIGSIYHIDKAYYDYLMTSRNAEAANLNPFIQPSGVLSNVEGGHGIFTFLSYDRDTAFIQF